MSRGPEAIDSLIALWKTTEALTGVKVLDGDPVTYVGGLYVSVGLGGDDVATEVTSMRAGMGARRDEVAEIPCAVWSAGGGTAMKPHRDRAFGLFAAAVAELARVRPAGAARAEVSTYTYRPRRASKGVAAAVEFTVELTFV